MVNKWRRGRFFYNKIFLTGGPAAGKAFEGKC
jgi:hypothetical protein